MKLLLTSAGLTNKTIAGALADLAGRPLTDLNLAFVPTAANVEPGDKWWLINDLVNCKNLGFKSIDIVDISALPQDIWQPRLEAADVFLFGGGNTFHLMRCLQESGLAGLLPSLLESRVFVGISAGSMVTCRSLDLSTSERLYSEEVGEFDSDEGLGYVDFLVRPHLNSPYFPNLNLENLENLATEFPETFYALDDNSAIKISGEHAEVISEGVWKKFN